MGAYPSRAQARYVRVAGPPTGRVDGPNQLSAPIDEQNAATDMPAVLEIFKDPVQMGG